MTQFRMTALWAIAFLGCTTSCETLWGQGRNETIAQFGQAVPGGNGFLSIFGNPLLNDSGEAAFFANLDGTSGGNSDNRGIFRGTGNSLTQIARKGQLAPNGNGTLSDLFNPVLSNSGATAFFGFLTGTSGGNADNDCILLGSGGSLTQIAREGQLAPNGNGTLSLLFTPVLNDSGTAAFLSNLAGTSGGNADNSGIFRSAGGSLTQIVRKGQLAPGGNGTLTGLGLTPSLNDSGTVAFAANLAGTSGGVADDNGIFRGAGGSLTQIAREGQLAPGGNGTLLDFYNPVLNNSGEAAFLANLTGTSGGSADDSGIFRGAGGSLTQIAREGQLAPNGNGTLSILNTPLLNDSGAATFHATLTGTSGGTIDDSGIFRGTGGNLTQIAREGQLVPEGNGTLSGLGAADLNDSGATSFLAQLTGTSGGSSDDGGIYAADGMDFLKVVREGDSMSGSTVTGIVLSTDSFNNWGQVTYRASLANGTQTIQRWTPDLHWRTPVSGSWDTGSQWTLGVGPDFVHNVLIDPAASLTVTGPSANKTVRTLQIGGGSGLATLVLQSGATLTSINGVTIASTGTLTGDGSIAGNVVNNGNILAANLTVVGTLTNQSVIAGSGRIHASITNGASGEIRALQGNTMRLTGASFSNWGLTEVHGGELRVSSALQNNSGSGLISMRSGSLIVSAGINNSGSIAFSQGSSTLRGDLNNTGIVQVSGGANATFFDDVVQNGTMQVATIGNTHSSAVILGSFSGSGGFTGGGDVFALGDLRPGNSPGVVTYDGNLFMGTSTDTFIELAGMALGEFDKMIVTGDLTLNGSLEVALIDGHRLSLNQKYRIVDVAGDLFGQFFGLSEGALVRSFGELGLFISYQNGAYDGITLFTGPTKNDSPYLTGDSFNAVPEPNSLILLACSTLGLVCQRRRKVHEFNTIEQGV